MGIPHPWRLQTNFQFPSHFWLEALEFQIIPFWTASQIERKSYMCKASGWANAHSWSQGSLQIAAWFQPHGCPVHRYIPIKLHRWPIQFSWLHGWLIMKLIWTGMGMGHVLTAPTLTLTERWWLMSLFTNMEEPSSDLIEASYVLDTIYICPTCDMWCYCQTKMECWDDKRATQ